ncbi:hypothetical protein Bca52824_017105 [Brassica carinata]|uniref:Reverse transcriptase zinc-binding domain-containing protein n=1 Tax=Brassica carinata TaxID=52824 RepID=A0A8X7VLL1_BRACI|nr:hypothetical protein Bca52824_017105 [Brassica carinata]
MQGTNHEEYIRLWKGKSDAYHPAFSTKHTWHLVRTVTIKKQWCGVVWFHLATPKFSIHTWLAVQDRLATCNRLVRWYVQAVAYSIWREINCRKHGEHHQPASRLHHMNDKIIRNRISTIQNTGRKGYERAMSVWFAYHTS